MRYVPRSPDKTIRVASVLARAAALSDELRVTIQELETILRRGEDDLRSGKDKPDSAR